MLSRIKYKIKLRKLKKRWREINSHNKTEINYILDINKIKVGNNSYGVINTYEWNTEGEGLEIGNFVSIAHGVKFILGGNHRYKRLTTYPFNVMLCNADINEDVYSNGKIVIEDDVWIGMDATILSGVTIGQGAVIATGSVVVKDIPPYTIVGGNPANVIKYRFDEKTINSLMNKEKFVLSEKEIINNLEEFHKEINKDDLLLKR